MRANLILLTVCQRKVHNMRISSLVQIIMMVTFVMCLWLPAGVVAEDSEIIIEPEPAETLDTWGGLVYNGSVSPIGTLAVTADSGSQHRTPANTPIGVLETLLKSGEISEYSIGDELMRTRGVLVLNGINGHANDQENGWYVKVNGIRLEDVVLSEKMGLNRYSLKEGDVLLYVLGDPQSMVSESLAYLTVTIGEVTLTDESTDVSFETAGEESKPEYQENSETDGATLQEDGTQTDPTDEEPELQAPETEGGLFNGSFPRPSGIIEIETDGADYEIEAATPIGLLHELYSKGKLSSVEFSDRAMTKAGILILEGINEYQYSGDKTWFVYVNGRLLKDYLNPDTEGLNIYKLSSGDEIGYYYGEPAQPVHEAAVSMIITLE